MLDRSCFRTITQPRKPGWYWVKTSVERDWEQAVFDGETWFLCPQNQKIAIAEPVNTMIGNRIAPAFEPPSNYPKDFSHLLTPGWYWVLYDTDDEPQPAYFDGRHWAGVYVKGLSIDEVEVGPPCVYSPPEKDKP